MLLSGLWMWKGHVLRRFVSKRSAIRVPQRNESHEVRQQAKAL
jgi:hypothetical protein